MTIRNTHVQEETVETFIRRGKSRECPIKMTPAGKPLACTPADMSAWQRWLLVVWLVGIVPRAAAHETDQFAIPPDRQFADLGDYFNRWAYHAMTHGVEQANSQIHAAMSRHAPEGVIADLQSASRVTMAVRGQWPWSVTQIETFEKILRSPQMRQRYPGRIVAYGDRFNGAYENAFFPLDIRQFAHILFFSSTIKVFGTYMGTDKFGHFTDEGISYYYEYRKARDAGADEVEAVAAAVRHGTHGLMSERGMLGLLANADYSNADLSGNFAGFLFYRNLTEPVQIKGELRQPTLVRDGPYWKLRSDIRADSGFFAAFISDHLDEALNPGYFDPYLRPAMRQSVRARTASLLQHYADPEGRPHNRAWFDNKLRELSTYWGTDYGHLGRYNELVSIGNSCFDGTESPKSSVRLVRAHVEHSSISQKLKARSTSTEGAQVSAARTPRLLTFGAPPRLRDSFGYTPLHDAARIGDVEAVRNLLDHGADARVPDDEGTTPLHLACRYGKLEIARLLLTHGADANATSNAGATPLHEAALAGDISLVQLLLANGASAAVYDVRGRTPDDIATANRFDDVDRLLRSPQRGDR